MLYCVYSAKKERKHKKGISENIISSGEIAEGKERKGTSLWKCCIAGPACGGSLAGSKGTCKHQEALQKVSVVKRNYRKEKRKKNYVGSENTPHINEGKEDT
eukprot:244482-Pelagomonas_calceolata.AAC.1